MSWNAISARIALATGNFAKLFKNVDIPPLPAVATRLMAICRDEQSTASDVARLISSDLGISAKVLRTVNSPHYGLRHKVTSVQQAIALLGIKQVAALVMAFSVARQLPTKSSAFDHVEFWQSSLQRSIFAQNVAAMISPGNEAEAFTGALLQDMALPILLGQWSTHYLRVFRLAGNFGRPLHEVEQEEFSWDHAQAGAWMARNWALPDVLVCCIGLHHTPLHQIVESGFLKTPVAAVAIASHLPDAQAMCRDGLGLSVGQYQEMCHETDAVCSELSSVFNVPTPEPLSQSYAGAR